MFLRGYVIYSSERVQWVETDSKIHPLIALIGDTYAYWCEPCGATVWEQEIMKMGARICPFCKRPVERIPSGTKVRLHYRFSKDGRWANWWGERFEW